MSSQGLVAYQGDRGYRQDGSKLRMRAAVGIRHLPFEAASQSQRGWTFEATTPRPGLLEYRSWYLLVDDNEHYLYVICEQSAASFPIMVQLTPDEYVEYHALGWTFLQCLAEKINHWASTYSARRVSNELQAAAEAVIAKAATRRDK